MACKVKELAVGFMMDDKKKKKKKKLPKRETPLQRLQRAPLRSVSLLGRKWMYDQASTRIMEILPVSRESMMNLLWESNDECWQVVCGGMKTRKIERDTKCLEVTNV